MYARAKLVWEKIGFPWRTRVESRNLDRKLDWKHRFKKSMIASKTAKTEDRLENMFGRIEKSNTIRTEDTTWREKP